MATTAPAPTTTTPANNNNSASAETAEKKKKSSLSITEVSAESSHNLIQTFFQDMAKLLDDHFLSDVSLAVGEPPVYIKAHRAVLSARCDYFNNLFRSQMGDSQKDTLFFPDKNAEDFKIIITYFYTAQLNINHENAFSVLKIADEYDIKGVKEKCTQYVRRYINEDNVFDVLEEARFHNFVELHSFCKNYLEKNAKQMFGSDSFLTISKETLIDLLASDKIHLSEIEIFFSVMEWGKFHVRNIIPEGASLKGRFEKKRKSSLLLRHRIARNGGHASLPPTAAAAASSKSPFPIYPLSVTTASSSSSMTSPRQDNVSDKQNAASTTTIPDRTPFRELHISEEEVTGRLSLSELSAPPQFAADETCTETDDITIDEDDDEFTLLDKSSTSVQSRQFNAMTNALLSSQVTDEAVIPKDPEDLKEKYAKIVDYTDDKAFVKKLKVYLADVLPHIRFPILNPHEIYDFVEPTKVVPKELLLEAYRSHALVNRVDIPESPRLKVREGSLYYVPGVQENVPLKWLRGWTCCYRKPYSDKTSEAVFELVKGPRILVAARHKNSSNLALCAMGRKVKVLKETFENETVKENGTYWYHWKNHSFGFSNLTTINLGSADLSPGTHKVSWHLTGRGGYRCGEIKNLNESEEWEKVIFYA